MMTPINNQKPLVSFLPPAQQEGIISFNASHCIMGTGFAAGRPLAKNIYILLDNSYSMISSAYKVIALIKRYFALLEEEMATHQIQHKISASLFDSQSTPIIASGGSFLQDIIDTFNAKGYMTLLAPGLERVIHDWLNPLNPDLMEDNLLILITDGENSDSKAVKTLRSTLINLLKIKSVAFYIFGLDDIATAKSAIDNFTDFKDDDLFCGLVDNTLKINYFFISNNEDIQKAVEMLTNHRVALKNATASLYSTDSSLRCRLVGYPTSRDAIQKQPSLGLQAVHLLGSIQISELQSLVIVIQNAWPRTNSLGISIDGIDPYSGNPFTSGIMMVPSTETPVIDQQVLLATLPKLTLEVRRSKDRNRQREVLNMIRAMKSIVGENPKLIENEQYLESALKDTSPTNEEDLLDALNSLSIS